MTNPLRAALVQTVEQLNICIAVMAQAEQLIGSENLHDKWHNDGKSHGAFHDLLFKRISAKEAITAAEAVLKDNQNGA